MTGEINHQHVDQIGIQYNRLHKHNEYSHYVYRAPDSRGSMARIGFVPRRLL